MKKAIIIIAIFSMFIPQISLAATDIEIEILKIRIKILELQIQRLLILLSEIQPEKEIAIVDPPIEEMVIQEEADAIKLLEEPTPAYCPQESYWTQYQPCGLQP